MRTDDERLMAYADGALDAAARADVERAVAADPALAHQLAAHQALRAALGAAYAPVLDEALPPRLLDMLAARPRLQLVPKPRPRWTAPEWGALAAGVVLAVFTVSLTFQRTEGSVLSAADGTQIAGGALARALDQHVSGAPGPVQIGLSFATQSGPYCRGFRLDRQAGLACRNGQQWKLEILTPLNTAPDAAYRQASSALPDEVMDAVDTRILGRPLDADAERAAMEQAWRRP